MNNRSTLSRVKDSKHIAGLIELAIVAVFLQTNNYLEAHQLTAAAEYLFYGLAIIPVVDISQTIINAIKLKIRSATTPVDGAEAARLGYFVLKALTSVSGFTIGALANAHVIGIPKSVGLWVITAGVGAATVKYTIKFNTSHVNSTPKRTKDVMKAIIMTGLGIGFGLMLAFAPESLGNSIGWALATTTASVGIGISLFARCVMPNLGRLPLVSTNENALNEPLIPAIEVTDEAPDNGVTMQINPAHEANHNATAAYQQPLLTAYNILRQESSVSRVEEVKDTIASTPSSESTVRVRLAS